MHCIETVCFDYYGTLVKIGKPYVRIRKWMCERLAEQGKEALVFHKAPSEALRRRQAFFEGGGRHGAGLYACVQNF